VRTSWPAGDRARVMLAGTGEVTETVEVEAATPLLQQTARPWERRCEKSVQDLPLNGQKLHSACAVDGGANEGMPGA